MAKAGVVVSGEVAFSNLTEHDTYNGKSTGNYTLTITMDSNEANKLSDMGVKIKEYKKLDSDDPVKLQRKFKSQYHVPVVDLDGYPVTGELPYGTKVRVLWTGGENNEDYGVPTYLQRVRVVEMAEPEMSVPEEF